MYSHSLNSCYNSIAKLNSSFAYQEGFRERNDNMQDFVAIDFETANTNRNSACQIGICQVQNGTIIGQRSWLIKPPSKIFTFSDLHGITYSMVKNQLTFIELWPVIKPYLEHQIVAAHNVKFDMSVLSAVLDYYQLPAMEFRVVDSLDAARKSWPNLQNHRLSTVAEFLSIDLNHHEALSDARACAEIILRSDWSRIKISPYQAASPRRPERNANWVG